MHLLVIGRIDGHLSLACQMAIKRRARVLNVHSVSSALESMRSGSGIDLVLVEMAIDISALVSEMKKARISLPVVACGTNPDARQAAAAIKAGAQEFLPLPPDEDMIAAIFQAVSQDRHHMLVFDDRMMKVVKLVERIASSQASVLITGSSGTGKEMIARHIHNKSNRATEAFIAVNCAAIPENLLESELFGYERGAFTGAVARRIGHFEEANRGTLLLDEISEMDTRLQSKLLRVIQEKEINRLGGKRPVSIDVRILATSNRDMKKAVASGQFREDLYFRLNVVEIRIPELKDRPGDIAGLIKHFVQQYAKENDRAEPSVSVAARQVLMEYSWPGNVRELENTIHRAILVCDGVQITTDHIDLTTDNDPGLQTPANKEAGEDEALQARIIASNVGRTVADVEKDLIINTLGRCLGNRTAAARILGISVRTLRNKLRIYKDAELVSVQNS